MTQPPVYEEDSQVFLNYTNLSTSSYTSYSVMNTMNTPPNSPTPTITQDTFNIDESNQLQSPIPVSCSQETSLINLKNFKFPQSKTFLVILEEELEKIQEKFYSKDGEERMSSVDLYQVWKRIEYLEDSINILREQALEGR